MDFLSRPVSTPLAGRLQVPGDKSISHRALMLGAIAEGTTHIRGILKSEDTLATLNAFSMMGVDIEQLDADELIVHGVGLHGLQAPDRPLNLGNSGTSVRLLAGLLVGQSFDSELCGDASLMQRPMRRITAPLREMNAAIQCSDSGTLPVIICGAQALRGIHYQMPLASAQLKSALLLAGLYASGRTCVDEPALTRDHTERLLHYFACPVAKQDRHICVSSHPLRGKPVHVPGDISSAAFFMVAASIVPGSDIMLENVGLNPTRHAVLEILGLMGADISTEKHGNTQGEPVADIRIRAGKLHGIHIPQALVPIAIDEFPAIFIAAAYAEGETTLAGAAELRVKESDRIKAMAEGLHRLGIDVREYEDGMRITGGRCLAGEVESYADHRIAMAFAIAGLSAAGPVRISDCINVNTSFPGFVDCASQLGMAISESDADE